MLYKFLILFACYFSLFNLTNASESSRIVRSASSTLTIQVDIEQEKLYTNLSDKNEISYYQSLVLAVPYDGDITLVGLSLGTLNSFYKTNQLSLAAGLNKVIEFSEPLLVRGKKYVTVFIFPVTQDGIYDQIEFSVQFTGTTSNLKTATVDSPFEKMMSHSVLNYDQSQQFLPGASRSFSLDAASGPFTGNSEWIKIEINKNGLYKLTGAQLDATGLTITGQLSSSIRMYNGGGKQLPVPNEIERPEFTEIALKVIDGGDGVFNSNDYILFYGEAVNRWVYDTSQVAFESHSYTERNIYWLNASSLTAGLRIESVDASLDGVVGGKFSQSYDRYTRRVHVEQNNTLRRLNDNKVGDYYTWYWTNKNNLSFFVSTENIVAGDTVAVTLEGVTGVQFDSPVEAIELFVNGNRGFNEICKSNAGCTYSSTSFVDGSNSIDMALLYFTNIPYFNYMELAYTSYNQPVNNQLDLTLGQLSGNTEIEVINSFSSNPLIFDISNPSQPRELIISTYGSNFSFYDSLSTTKYNRYFLMPDAQSLTPAVISSITTADLYTTTNQTDLIVISPRFLQASLGEYISYRRNSGYTIQSVSVEDIMDNFGFGLFDPTAIRDFLKNSYETYPDPKPSAVLFVGDASYDFLNNLSTNMPNYVPPYTHRIDNTASDDNYVFFGVFGIIDSDSSYNQSPFDRGFDMMTSRWPIRSASDVQIVTDKIISYESTNNFGNWRNNITLVSDDEFGTFDNEYFHTIQIEELEQYHLPILYNRQKIYLWEYPFVNGEKPEVNNKIVNAINNGSLLVNYVGHGNPDVWAHENVFNRAGDLPKLENSSKLPLFIAASCAIGFYDDPLREGMAEELLSMSSGGAIGVISATRLVYSADNSAFNKKIYDILFDDNSLSISQALYTAKLERQYVGGIPRPRTNDRNYLFFGGPFVKMAKPKYDIEFISPPDSLVALGQTIVTGRVIDENGSPIIENGTIEINVLDSKRNKTYVAETYSVNGPTIYRGSATVNNGAFEFQFVSPLDIGFGGEGAQISVYASFQSVDASGIIDAISISDSIAVTSDSLGPEIDITFSEHQNFSSGDIVRQGESMIVEFSDESGINLAGGLGHGITLEIDDQSEKIHNLTSYFSYDQDSFSKGSLQFQLDELEPGVHSFKIKAWDNANNFAKIEFDVEINGNSSLQIVNLLNYPNPMRESTRFSFNLTQPVDNFVLDIFTLSGKKIKTFSRQYLEASYFDDIVWYGDDVDGDRVATEVYIYKATAYPSGGGNSVELFGKIILVN